MKKPGIAIMFGGLKKDEPLEQEDDGSETAAEAFLKAVKSEDPKALVEAFRSMVTLCDVEEEDEE